MIKVTECGTVIGASLSISEIADLFFHTKPSLGFTEFTESEKDPRGTDLWMEITC